MVATGKRDASNTPRVRSMKSTMNGFALRDVDAASMFIIDVLVERRPVAFNACFDIESGYFKRQLRANEL